jgi:hypothetical protein
MKPSARALFAAATSTDDLTKKGLTRMTKTAHPTSAARRPRRRSRLFVPVPARSFLPAILATQLSKFLLQRALRRAGLEAR